MDTKASEESSKAAQVQYQAGKDTFERGQYRESVQHLEKAVSLLARNSPSGGEAQIWLVTAYEAAGQQSEAIALCEQLSRHPDPDTRKQGSRLLYILKAPRLKTRPEWLSQIPDLTALDHPEQDSKGAYVSTAKRSTPPPRAQPEPADLSQVNTQDNRFIWVALGAIALLLGSLIWFN